MLSNLYVIFRGFHTDWFIPIENRCEGLKWKTVMLTWAKNKNIRVIISERLISSTADRKIVKFPEDNVKIMISDVISLLK